MTTPKTLLLCAAGTLLLSACAHQEPTRIRDDFGKSNEAMMAAQIFDLEAARNPSPQPPTGMDGAKAALILKTYREDVSERDFEDTTESITVLTAQ